MTPFQRLLIIRCIRPDKVSLAIQDFIKVTMGEQYLSPPPFDLAGSHADSSVSQPLVFVLSPGSDPMAALLYFADTVKKKVDSISLGQGQVGLAMSLLPLLHVDELPAVIG
jgi:dynein heavy chain